MSTHETFIQAVADTAASRLSSTDAEKVRAIKLVYGAGPAGVRGVTYFNKWHHAAGVVPFVEISALNQESVVQVAGTVLHELGHVLAEFGAGHGKLWHEACAKLGLRCVKAAGTNYTWANFSPDIREAVTSLKLPKDGQPNGILLPNGLRPKLRVCGAGIGTRGGKSQGAGSGSRLRLWECECIPAIKLRVAKDDLDISCNCCNTNFLKK